MIRTQIQLTEEQARALKRLAAERGVSMADLIRQAADRIIEEAGQGAKWRRASALIGRYSSGRSDVSAEHDKYLAEDYG